MTPIAPILWSWFRRRKDDNDAYYGLDQVDEESDADDAATLDSHDDMPAAERDPPRPQAIPVPRRQARTARLGWNMDSWNRHVAITTDLEALFEHMLTHKFGISPKNSYRI